MRGSGEQGVVGRERVVKIAAQKVRQKWCRNGAEMERGKATTEVITSNHAKHAKTEAWIAFCVISTVMVEIDRRAP
jgi:hypothetical protein